MSGSRDLADAEPSEAKRSKKLKRKVYGKEGATERFLLGSRLKYGRRNKRRSCFWSSSWRAEAAVARVVGGRRRWRGRRRGSGMLWTPTHQSPVTSYLPHDLSPATFLAYNRTA